MKHYSPTELKHLIDNNVDIQVIDVREQEDFEECGLHATNFPMSAIDDHIAEISTSRSVVMVCRTGARSSSVIARLERDHGFTNLYLLQGGVLAYLREYGS